MFGLFDIDDVHDIDDNLGYCVNLKEEGFFWIFFSYFRICGREKRESLIMILVRLSRFLNDLQNMG